MNPLRVRGRLRREHSQGPVDRLAGDRLAVAQELADRADAVPVGAELAGSRLLILGQPALAPAVPAAGRGSGQAVFGALADEVAPDASCRTLRLCPICGP